MIGCVKNVNTHDYWTIFCLKIMQCAVQWNVNLKSMNARTWHLINALACYFLYKTYATKAEW